MEAELTVHGGCTLKSVSFLAVEEKRSSAKFCTAPGEEFDRYSLGNLGLIWTLSSED